MSHVDAEEGSPATKKAKLRQETEQFTEPECDLLVQLYTENRARYHGRFASGSANGKSSQDLLAMEWAVQCTDISGIIRDTSQVKQKLNDLRKRAKEYLGKLKREANKTGGGRFNILVKPHLRMMAESIENDENIQGIAGAADGDVLRESKEDGIKFEAEVTEETPKRQPNTSCSHRWTTAAKSDELAKKRKELIELEIEVAKKKLYREELAIEHLRKEEERKVELHRMQLLAEEAKVRHFGRNDQGDEYFHL